MFAKSLIATVAFATLALAQSATVIVEASHGGAGNGLTNTTITVPFGSPFTGDPALQAVSTLYLTAASGADVNSVTCTPFKNTDGTGSGGNPFTVSSPSLLSTNTVQVGSIVCALSTSGSQSATVIVEASHGGAGVGLTNTTITVPLGAPFTSDPSLQAVSTLYLTGASNADVNSITCTPFKNADGTGSSGNAFTVSSPSLLSTNTVQVGSIVCAINGGSSSGGSSSGGSGGSGGSGSSSTTPGSKPTSTTSGKSSPTGGSGSSNSASGLTWSAAGTLLVGSLTLALGL